MEYVYVCVRVCVSHLQRLSGSHKALVEMQDDVAELLRSATQDYASTKVREQFFIGNESGGCAAAAEVWVQN